MSVVSKGSPPWSLLYSLVLVDCIADKVVLKQVYLTIIRFFLVSQQCAILSVRYWRSSSIWSSRTMGFSLIPVKSKAIPVTGRGGPYCCETSRLPHLLENRLTDGGEVVSLTRHAIPVTGRGDP
jgi:hypothetical protein